MQLTLVLLDNLTNLNLAIAALAGIKDLRSPLLLRVMLRAGCVLLAPLIQGSWLAGLAYQSTLPGHKAGAVGIVFAIVIGAIVSAKAHVRDSPRLYSAADSAQPRMSPRDGNL